jgi:radical SAM protein with 4Fe4S-binding SPASM domain
MSNSSKSKLPRYLVELTTTQSCNFRCNYCFENDKKTPYENVVFNNLEFVKKQINKVFNDEWFNSKFETFQIAFWGGEPSLNINMFHNIIDEFEKNEKISFYIYTNGTMVKEMLPSLLKCKGKKVGGEPKFITQISYDGNPANDLTRIPKNGRIGSEIVKEALSILKENDLDFSLKATLEHKNFKYLPEIWDDFYNLYKSFGERVKYALTIDYHNIEIEKYYKDLEKSLLEIAKREKEFYKETKRFLSTIFEMKKAFCSAGKQSMTIDIDGSIYLCHGCLYSSSKEELKYSSIFSDTFLDDIKNKFKEVNTFFIEECENCVSMLCLRCNVKKYELSNKKIFLDKWNDYTNQKELCKYYKLCGRIGRALLEVLKEENPCHSFVL